MLPLPSIRIHSCSDHFAECEFTDIMEYRMGFASKQTLKSTVVPSVHKVPKQLVQLELWPPPSTQSRAAVPVPPPSLTLVQLLPRPRERERGKYGSKESLQGLFAAFQFLSSKAKFYVKVKSIVKAVVKLSTRFTVQSQCCAHWSALWWDLLYCAAPA